MTHDIPTRLLRLAGALALAATAIPSWAQSEGGPAAATDGAWHFTVAPYFWASGISGTVSVANLQLPIDLPFSDVISDVDFGLQGNVEGRKDRLGFGLNVMYANIGAPVDSDARWSAGWTSRRTSARRAWRASSTTAWRAGGGATIPPSSTSRRRALRGFAQPAHRDDRGRDYEDGKVFDIAYDGPRAWASYSW